MPNTSLADASNTLLFVAVIFYSVSMLGYAAEAAFGQRQRRRRSKDVVIDVRADAARAAAAAQERELVGAGAARATRSAGGAVDRTGVPTQSRSDLGTAAGRAERRTALAAAEQLPPTTGAGARFGQAAVVLTAIGWLLHLGSVVTRGLAAGRVPWGNMYEFSCMIGLLAVAAFLVLLTRQPVRYLGAFVMAPVTLYLGLAGSVLYTDAGPLVPALHSYWLAIHVSAASLASGAFLVGFVATVLYLVRDRFERGLRFSGLGRLLPSSSVLDRTAYGLIAFAFPVWTFAVIAGAIWAEAAWGRYWGWDPKETWSFITWVVYAGYLHARATAGWRGRKSAYVAVAGFFCLTANYFLVNLVFAGLHSYAGVS